MFLSRMKRKTNEGLDRWIRCCTLLYFAICCYTRLYAALRCYALLSAARRRYIARLKNEQNLMSTVIAKV